MRKQIVFIVLIFWVFPINALKAQTKAVYAPDSLAVPVKALDSAALASSKMDSVAAKPAATTDSLKTVVDSGKKKREKQAVVIDSTVTDPYQVKTYLREIPFNRRYFHEDKIDKELKKADLADGFLDKKIRYKPDTSFSAVLTKAILVDAAFLQVMIENMPSNGRDTFNDQQDRIRYLKSVYNLLHEFNTDPEINPEYYKQRVANLHDMIVAGNEGRLGSFVVKNTSVYTLDNSKLILDNHRELRAYIYTRIGRLYPKMMIRRLTEYATDTFAGAIIKADAPLEPDLIFNYATSINGPITNAVHRTKDPFVQAISKIADKSKAPVKAMAFLGEIYAGRKTVEQVDALTADPEVYFKNLVQLKLADDSIARKTYTAELGLRSLKYIREMNELHETTDVVRFKCLEDMSALETYYIMVFGQDEIYTSSFLGSFKRLLEKMKPQRGDQFLDSIHHDKFRTFIRMCAGYNTLSDFLQTMDSTARTALMSSFIDNLQKGRKDDLEDAVDVADAFGSITDTSLATFLQKRVKGNYEKSYAERSKKGVIIYSLLARLFEGNQISGSDTGAKVISDRMGLPNINLVPFENLTSDSGTVYQQVFFFGDEDGLHSFEHYLEVFRTDRRWKITPQKYWYTISSVTGKKVVIYANQPLPEPQDDEAIDSLSKFLTDAGIHPSIIIHRGHSYHLPVTLQKLNKYVKIVILGSCGGYHNLATVLEHAPDAHIVSSKQTGTMGVNEEIIRSMNNSLIAGEDVNWINMWHGLEVFFNKKHNEADKDKFSDYVPPYKNLGAIFIKAYKRMMGM